MSKPVGHASWSPAERRLYATLLRVRPAEAGALLKRLLGVRRRAVAVADGFTMFVDPVSNFGYRTLAGEYEPEVAAVVRAVMRPGDAMVDVGANEGYFSLLAGWVVPGARVISVEPQAALARWIAENASVNGLAGCVSVYRLAASDQVGRAELTIMPSTNTGAASLLRRRRGARTEVVATMPLDDILRHAGVAAVRLAKIDCEGAEGQVVRGARETLAGRRVEFIVIEYHPAVTGHDACRAVDHELRDYGYAVTRLGSGLWVYHVPEARAALAPLGPLTAVAPL